MRSVKRLLGRGFTLVELVLVLVLVGILAVYAMPKLIGRSSFDSSGMHNGTLAYLRYAQKTAIAQRRTVCVAFTSVSVALSVAGAAGATSCSSGKALAGPDGNAAFSVSGQSYAATPTSFNFDALGEPLSAANGTVLSSPQSLAVSGWGKTIIVEALTGYVHEQ